MKIHSVKEYYNADKHFADCYIISENERYVIDKHGDIIFFYSLEEAMNHLTKKPVFGRPNSDTNELFVYQIDNGFVNVYDGAMNIISETNSKLDAWAIDTEFHYDRNKFINFDFRWKDDVEDIDDPYDIEPDYNDPRYNGPYHYIPPNE